MEWVMPRIAVPKKVVIDGSCPINLRLKANNASQTFIFFLLADNRGNLLDYLRGRRRLPAQY
jgi:hypothetical protein